MPIKRGSTGLILPPGIARVYAGAAQVYQKAASPGGGLSFEDALVAHYAQDASTITDLTGNTTPVNITGSSPVFDSDFDAYVQGIGDYRITTPIQPGSYAISVWVKPINVANVNRIWIAEGTSDAWHMTNINLTLFIGNHDEVFAERFSFDNFFVNNEEWLHLINAWDGATNKHTLYVDGVLFHESTTGSNLTGTFSNVFIGGSGGGNWFQGHKHNVRLFDRWLSPAEALELYNFENPYS